MSVVLLLLLFCWSLSCRLSGCRRLVVVCPSCRGALVFGGHCLGALRAIHARPGHLPCSVGRATCRPAQLRLVLSVAPRSCVFAFVATLRPMKVVRLLETTVPLEAFKTRASGSVSPTSEQALDTVAGKIVASDSERASTASAVGSPWHPGGGL